MTEKVKIVRKIPKNLHSPIIYSIGIVADRVRPQVLEAYEYLLSAKSLECYIEKGFSVLDNEVVDVDG